MLLRHPLTWMAVAALALAGCTEPGALEISQARVRAVIPGQDKTAAYFTAHNPGDSPVVLTGVESDQVRAIEMHTTIRDGDMMRMQRLLEVVVPAGETVRFEPGRKHLMVFGTTALGDHLDAVVNTRDHGGIQVRFDTVGYGDD